MINVKDVLTIKIPYPTINSKLAVQAHMYICKNNVDYEFIKCQTLKPGMLNSAIFKHYVDENANSNRNPFRHKTRIDCDKIFVTKNVKYDDGLKAKRNVCEDLYNNVIIELNTDGYNSIMLDENDLVLLNSLITYK